jgi:diguanylate cyclase (GGDEF)-like protein
MAMIEISDDVLAALRADAQARHRSDASALLGLVARQYLFGVCAPGFDRDALTGLRARAGLKARLRAATSGSSWTDTTLYQERFLCVDLDNFKSYLDPHGLAAGDVVLRGLADGLREHFGGEDVYRFGGDEFVVVLGDREAWLPAAPTDVTLSHAIVAVAMHRNPARPHHVYEWIETHLDGAMLLASRGGSRLACEDPIWLRSGRP